MSDQAKGSCACGTVHWAVKPPYRFFQYCHCSRCRKRTGSAHAANIAVLDGQLEWLAGEDKVTRFELPSAKSWCNAFCSTCGSAAPWKTRNGRAFIVPAGGLDEPTASSPDRNVDFASRASWYVHAAELPIFDAEP
jgi:hypothetical protein